MQNQKAELRPFIRHYRSNSGVYLMKDRLGHVIYVGKAKFQKKGKQLLGLKRFIQARV